LTTCFIGKTARLNARLNQLHDHAPCGGRHVGAPARAAGGTGEATALLRLHVQRDNVRLVLVAMLTHLHALLAEKVRLLSSIVDLISFHE